MLEKPLSIYLDFLRLFAAIAVLAGHADAYLIPEIPRFLASHADEGVAVFFVLSGFVISYVVSQKETDWRTYAFARFVRMFSVVPIALFITYCADMIGISLNPSVYENNQWYSGDYVAALFHNLTFTNELWNLDVTFGSNHAYWSLGFEVQYYIGFGLLFFLPKPFRFVGFAFWAAFVGPIVATYFLLWGLGVAAYKIVSRSPKGHSGLVAAALFLGSLILYMVVKIYFSDYKFGLARLYDFDFKFISSLTYYLAVGFAVAMNIYAISGLREMPRYIGRRLQGAIRWLAGGSFTLYLVHEPLLVLSKTIVEDGLTERWLAIAAILIVCLLAAELGERRKHLYKSVFLRFGGARFTKRA